jgi:hypothetical protein
MSDYTKDAVAVMKVLISPRAAGSLVLGFALSVGMAVLFHGPYLAWMARVPALGSWPVLLALFGVAVATAALFVHGIICAVAGTRAALRRRAARKESARTKALAEAAERLRLEAKAEETRANLRRILPSLPNTHLVALRAYEAAESPINGPIARETDAELEAVGFLTRVATLGARSCLRALHPDAVPIVREFFTEQRHAAYQAALHNADDVTRSLLSLFTIPEPPPHEPAHPLLSAEVYGAHDALVGAGVLRSDPVQRRRPGVQQVLTIATDAVPFVESLVLGRPIARSSVGFDMRYIRSNVDSGSGVRSGY